MCQNVNIIVYIWSPNLAICAIAKIGGCTRLFIAHWPHTSALMALWYILGGGCMTNYTPFALLFYKSKAMCSRTHRTREICHLFVLSMSLSSGQYQCLYRSLYESLLVWLTPFCTQLNYQQFGVMTAGGLPCFLPAAILFTLATKFYPDFTSKPPCSATIIRTVCS